MGVLLQPVDTFFFRNHRSLNAGEDSAASGFFPPLPSTLYGALRSAYIHARGGFESFYQKKDPHLMQWMGTPEGVGDFALKGFYLYDDAPVFPLPLDYQVVSRKKDHTAEQALPLQLRGERDGYVSHPSGFLLYGASKEKSSSAAGAYVDFAHWKAAMLTHAAVPVFRSSYWLVPEYRVGIARDPETRRTVSEMFYQLEMLRMKETDGLHGKTGLAVVFRKAPDFTGIHLALLGGENRPWNLVQVDDVSLYTKEEEEELVEHVSRNGILRVVLLTPAIWGKGNRPNAWDETTRQLRLSQDLQVEVIAAAIGRPLLIGGWDMAKGRPKKRRFAVPAGSVLYLRVQPEQVRPLIESIHEYPLTDKLAHEGYGWAVCGAYSDHLE